MNLRDRICLFTDIVRKDFFPKRAIFGNFFADFCQFLGSMGGLAFAKYQFCNFFAKSQYRFPKMRGGGGVKGIMDSVR